MVSFSAINWVPNSVNSQYLLGLLRDDLGFNGFTISDYNELEFSYNNLMPRTFMNFTDEESAYSTLVNAGVDMFMVNKKAIVERLFKHAKTQVTRNHIPQERFIEAATRIISVKLAMGLVEKVQM
jgi:beta-glucosidase